ncbi:hypothetical protein HPP92_019715 [Vanilla planifolia]|uniref:Uncharacterized protein n=1 Tax=Vanilla planifolia TaxID=51239 RepID=A0A835ULD8_VANPL|nr:hypothetical protein HPP92_019715 [Vanilla planifolia]
MYPPQQSFDYKILTERLSEEMRRDRSTHREGLPHGDRSVGRSHGNEISTKKSFGGYSSVGSREAEPFGPFKRRDEEETVEGRTIE